MSTYEILPLMIAFAILMVVIIKKSIIKIKSMLVTSDGKKEIKQGIS